MDFSSSVTIIYGNIDFSMRLANPHEKRRARKARKASFQISKQERNLGNNVSLTVVVQAFKHASATVSMHLVVLNNEKTTAFRPVIQFDYREP